MNLLSLSLFKKNTSLSLIISFKSILVNIIAIDFDSLNQLANLELNSNPTRVFFQVILEIASIKPQCVDKSIHNLFDLVKL